ncbi:hypothetical protein L465_00380 [Enterobacter sp. BIDMC 29]|nr:hypothetical protein L465_00380 [Enterobacter sp. BIDMC 29]
MTLIRKAFRRLHYPVDIIAQCVHWYLVYSLSLRNLEEMMAERGIIVDHSPLHRWVIRMVPLLDKVFRRYKRRPGGRWRMDETYMGSAWKTENILRYACFLYRLLSTERKSSSPPAAGAKTLSEMRFFQLP